jgi:hypothetical protein
MIDYINEIEEIISQYKYEINIYFPRGSNRNDNIEFNRMTDYGRVSFEIFIPSDSDTKSPSRMLRLEKWFVAKFAAQNNFTYKFSYVKFQGYVSSFYEYAQTNGFENSYGDIFHLRRYVTKEELAPLFNNFLNWSKPEVIKKFKDMYK